MLRLFFTLQKNILMTDIKLTQFSHSSGCGCKIAPEILDQITSTFSKNKLFEKLIVGHESKDDAAVWDLGDDQALISTVDFFMPIVNNAFDFGRIAAANALSDVYAMGGNPIFANAILGWPVDKIPVELAAKVLEGAKNICEIANIPIAGGHSINSSEPIFGLAVNGQAKISSIKKNNSAQIEDFLFLTKPIGTGIMGTAIKRELADANDVKEAIESMCKLNKVGEALGKIKGVSAMTDVSGFALLGHLIEMCEGSNVSAEIFANKIPVFNFIDTYLEQNCVPDNTYRNWNSYEKKVNGLTDLRNFQLLNDPQTSGGLLIAVNEKSIAEVQNILVDFGLTDFIEPIGCIKDLHTFSVEIK